MIELLFTVLVLLLVVAGMAVGVLMGRRPLQGSCGGLANIGLDGECEICGGNPASCDRETKAAAGETDLGYSAAGAPRSQSRDAEG